MHDRQDHVSLFSDDIADDGNSNLLEQQFTQLHIIATNEPDNLAVNLTT